MFCALLFNSTSGLFIHRKMGVLCRASNIPKDSLLSHTVRLRLPAAAIGCAAIAQIPVPSTEHEENMTENHPPHRLGSARAKSGGPFRDHREPINRAREAAEALFRPKRQVTQPPVSEPQPSVSESQPPVDLSARKPRILTSSSTVPARHAAVEAPANPEPPAPSEIPASQLAQIRVWVKYGMTIPQVAQIYGVAVGEIERILKA
jgi:hypothetical protein